MTGPGARTVAPGVMTTNGRTFAARASVGGTTRYLGTVHDVDLARALVLDARAHQLLADADVLRQEAAALRASAARRKAVEDLHQRLTEED